MSVITTPPHTGPCYLTADLRLARVPGPEGGRICQRCYDALVANLLVLGAPMTLPANAVVEWRLSPAGDLLSRVRACDCEPCRGECNGRTGNPAHDGYCCEPCRSSAGRRHTVECTYDFNDGCEQKPLEPWQEVVQPRPSDDLEIRPTENLIQAVRWLAGHEGHDVELDGENGVAVVTCRTCSAAETFGRVS